MPLEVKELIIKATVDRPVSTRPQNETISPQYLKQLKREIIEECIEKVFKTLERKSKR